MAFLFDSDDDDKYGPLIGSHARDTYIQIGLSGALGVSAFIGFCLLRPRWPGLYAARKKQRNAAEPLPELPDSIFGWIPVLLRVTEQQVLASAGLDAYVFLRFFRMATKWLAVALFFSLCVFKPVHDSNPEDVEPPKNDTDLFDWNLRRRGFLPSNGTSDPFPPFDIASDYLRMYLIFAYIFTALAVYLLVTETEKIIGIRQEYLGTQSTITDRTIRLSGIPRELRSKEKIKDFVERLEIGKVESVTVCCDWKELDALMDHRKSLLRKLEESWAVYLVQRHQPPRQPRFAFLRRSQPKPNDAHDEALDDEESAPLMPEEEREPADEFSHARPKATIRSGFLGFRTRYVDAIDHYEALLRDADEKIKKLRASNFEATPIAFVTMDSVAACQMAVQAVLDPSPMQLIASLSPAPIDVVWRNTYLPRNQRMIRGWTITVVITLLTIFWSGLLVPIAGSLNLETIKKFSPSLANLLKDHPFLKSLVNTQLPTLASTLLFVAVPYLYDWLANLQGMTSQGEIEMSVISKNFFFVFFNYFVILTIFGTISNFYSFFKQFQDSLKDFTRIAYTLAEALQRLQPFYTNLVILQGLGLFPLRLLEFGSVFLYPIYRIGAKTPRDYAELVQPPVFNYGFYLPQVMLIYLICIVYSILRQSWMILLAGLVYFVFGGFVYKYQLLYAMDHRQHSTGRAWVMICNRMMIGLVIFQLTTAGQLALKSAYARSLAVVPLILGTISFSYYYAKNYAPLMQFIALNSIERRAPPVDPSDADPDGWGQVSRARYEAENQSNDSRDGGMRFENPSLEEALEEPWIAGGETRQVRRQDDTRRRFESAMNAQI